MSSPEETRPLIGNFMYLIFISKKEKFLISNDLIQLCNGELRMTRSIFGFSSRLHNNFCCDDKNLLGKKQVLTRDKLDLDGKEPAFANTRLYTFKIPPPWKTPNFHLNKICESLIYLLAETHHLFLQTKHNKLSGNFKRMSEYFPGKFVFLFW